MAGFTPNEGETLIAEIIHGRISADRDADLELGLFTNAAADETTTEATITEPTGGAYARKTLTDASWTITNDVASYAKQTFTATGGNMTGSIYGYFLATKSAGGTQRIVYMEIDSNGPYTLLEGQSYDVTPSTAIG
jgi:hypothetical protein